MQILEAEAHLDDQPRAAHYGSAALPDLDRAGVLAEVKKRGIIINDFAFRYAVPAGSPEDKDGSGFAHIATLDTSCVKDVDGFDYRSHCLVLQDLDALMLEMLIDRIGDDVVSWRHRVVDVGQDEERKVAWVDVVTPEGRKRVEGEYVVGCDGASSQVRRSLFGQDYPGFTWEKQIVATNTYYDFTKFGWGDVNMIIHPDNFFASRPPQNHKRPGYSLSNEEVSTNSQLICVDGCQNGLRRTLPCYIWRKVRVDEGTNAGTPSGQV